MLPNEKGVSLPLISLHEGDLIVERLFYFQVVRPNQPLRITSPRYVARYNLSQAKFESIKKLDVDENQEMLEIPAVENQIEKPIEYTELWDLYNQLLRPFQNGQSANFDQKTINAATRFRKAFKHYAEKPLLKYYENRGGGFFAFVEKVAKYGN